MAPVGRRTGQVVAKRESSADLVAPCGLHPKNLGSISYSVEYGDHCPAKDSAEYALMDTSDEMR